MMTKYDDMRTIIDIPEDDIDALKALCEAERISRAEAVRRAVRAYVKGKQADEQDEAFGLWKDRDEDGLAYQQRLRDEWAD